MFKTRLLSGIVLVIIALATIICGGPVLFVTLLCVSLIGMQELYKAAGVREGKINLLEIISYGGILAYYLSVWFLPEKYHLLAVIFGLLLIMFVYVFTYPKYQAGQIMASFFGIVYVGVMLSYIFQTRQLPDGAFLVWLIFLCSWGCDTCAYCVGVLIGKHKMAPVLSPKKSIEGAVGGVLGAALLGALYALAIASHNPNSGHTPLIYAVICAVGALVSMVGDLAASAIKRQQNIKDYGTLIPGHGGILDRFDSVIFTAPIIYFLAVVLI
ncbi:MAG: phosphatidate cytidylyltransferase [Clostridiales bacterium]|nr:phosphatidate cytidylyltransferase [Clostridiales bacterium]